MSSAKQFPLKILEEDGPFEYVYLSIASIPGIKFPSDSTGPILRDVRPILRDVRAESA